MSGLTSSYARAVNPKYLFLWLIFQADTIVVAVLNHAHENPCFIF